MNESNPFASQLVLSIRSNKAANVHNVMTIFMRISLLAEQQQQQQQKQINFNLLLSM